MIISLKVVKKWEQLLDVWDKVVFPALDSERPNNLVLHFLQLSPPPTHTGAIVLAIPLGWV